MGVYGRSGDPYSRARPKSPIYKVFKNNNDTDDAAADVVADSCNQGPRFPQQILTNFVAQFVKFRKIQRIIIPIQ